MLGVRTMRGLRGVGFADGSETEAAMPIDRSEFAVECLKSAFSLGVSPHYLMAIAQLRSGISDDTENDLIGPFRLSPAQWSAALNRLQSFVAADINDWLLQCTAIALMTRVAHVGLAATSALPPTALELYVHQWPETWSPTISTDLQFALNTTASLLGPALDSITTSRTVDDIVI